MGRRADQCIPARALYETVNSAAMAEFAGSAALTEINSSVRDQAPVAVPNCDRGF